MPDQLQKIFFDPTADRRYPQYPDRPSEDDIRAWLDTENCPLNEVVVNKANRGAMQTLKRIAFTAFRSMNHSLRGSSFGIYSGPGQGKTHVVRCFARTMGVPFLFIQSDALDSTWQLVQQIEKKFKEFETPLVEISPEYYSIPPCIVFFDEAHALSKDLRTGGLLNAMESSDGYLRVTPPGKDQKERRIDCAEVCWIAATTDPGRLFKESEAFYSRFSLHIVWQNATPSQIARIVKKRHPHFQRSVCELVAYYCKIPRQALGFATQMQMQFDFAGGTWEEAAQVVAENNGIDQFGMLYKQVHVLQALGKRPVAKPHLIIPARCRIEELEQMVLPRLLDETAGGPLVMPTAKGMAITKAGLAELDRRGIPHNGEEVTAENIT